MKHLGAASCRRLVEALQSTPLYRQYQQAFRKATGLGLMLRIPETDEMPAANERAEQNSFCREMSTSAFNCDACASSRKALKNQCGTMGASGHCFAHMSISALPVTVGDTLIAYIWTGQVFVTGKKTGSFTSISRMLHRAGAGAGEIARLHLLWKTTPEIPEEQYTSVVTLLRIFAQQLGESAAALLLQGTPGEPESVRKARHYVRDHLTNRITLEEVSRHAGLSPHHFSRIFHEASGLTLTDYINRSRIGAARQLLLKDGARVSEVAFEVGYQSLSQFNRSFLRITGRSPLNYRRQLLKPEVRRAS